MLRILGGQGGGRHGEGDRLLGTLLRGGGAGASLSQSSSSFGGLRWA